MIRPDIMLDRILMGGEPVPDELLKRDELLTKALMQKASVPDTTQVNAPAPKVNNKVPVRQSAMQPPAVQPIQPMPTVEQISPGTGSKAAATFGNILGQPGSLAYLLGTLASATSYEGTWTKQLGDAMAQIGRNQQYGAYLDSLLRQLAGEQNPFQSSPIQVPKSPAAVIGLSPEEQTAGVSSALASKRQELEEKKAPFNALYQVALAKSVLEKSTMDKLQMLASFADSNGIKMDSVKVDLGDKVALLAFDPTEGKHKVTLMLKKGEAPESKGASTNTSYLTLGRKEAATSLYPIIEDVLRAMFPKEKEFSERLSVLKDDKGALNVDNIIAMSRNISPELANIWDHYFTRLERTLKEGGNISDVVLPKVKKNAIRFVNDEYKINMRKDVPEFYTGKVIDNGVPKYIILFKPENSKTLTKVFEYELQESK